VRPPPGGELHDPGWMEVSLGAPTAGTATGAGLVAQVGGQQRLPPHEGGQELGHLGVDGLEALAELGQA
jgi:hypothetical protein